MSAKALLAALFIAAPTIAIADNHDTGDHVPYCGDEAAKRSPTCIPYNGDIPARPDTGPWEAGPNGEIVHGFNVVYAGSYDGDLIDHCREQFGVGECAAIERPAVIIPASLPKPRRIGARSWCSYGGPWWCANHDSAPGQDEDRGREDRQTAEVDRPDRPERSEPPQRSEPPARQDPPRCD